MREGDTDASRARREGGRPDASRVAIDPPRTVADRLGVPFDDEELRAARRFPLRFPSEYMSLADPTDPADPIARIAWPDREELEADPEGLADPVGEKALLAHPLVIRKHADRVILLLTSRCHFYCRFCFRAVHRKDPSPAEVEEATRVIAELPDVREVILSGGDPLVLSDERLERAIAAVGAIPSGPRLRIHTRAPIHAPARITERLASVLAAGGAGRTWVVIHATHPRELRGTVAAAIDRLLTAGIPILAQTVLLRGVNDRSEILGELFEGLIALGVKPYYLHHPDAVPGTARFRITIERGLEIHRHLRTLVSGPALPEYVVDLPGGEGKVPVASLVPLGEGRWRAPLATGGWAIYSDPAAQAGLRPQ